VADDPPKKPSPKWLSDEHGNKDRARRSNTHERRVAALLPKGKRLPQSGGRKWSKNDGNTSRGDVQSVHFLVEHKRTDLLSMSLKREWLEKVRGGAARILRDPAIVVTFEYPSGRCDDWIMVPLDVARRRMGYVEDENGVVHVEDEGPGDTGKVGGDPEGAPGGGVP
jgi:hypothetical protein